MHADVSEASSCDDHGGEAGMVTVEMAIGLMSAVLVLVALLVALSVGVSNGQACQAAREAARAASIGATAAPPAAGSQRAVSVNVEVSDSSVVATASVAAIAVGPFHAPAVTCQVSGVREPYLQWGSGG